MCSLYEVLDWQQSDNYINDMLNKVLGYEEIVIFGAGIGGRITLELLEEHKLIDKVKAFSDNNESKLGTTLSDIKVIKPSEITKEYPDALILISSTAFDIISEQLMDYGIDSKNIYYFQPAGMKLGNKDSEFIKDNINQFQQVYAMLEDEKSRKIYCHLLNYRINKSLSELEDLKEYIDEEKTQYFDQEILNNYDIKDGFADCGAYVGDTIKNFVSYYPQFRDKIFAFEADDEIYVKLCRDTCQYDNVEAFQYAVWDKYEELLLDTTSAQNGGSRIGETGVSVKAGPLDELIGEERVGFIKMDIEGAERAAIIGAKKIIKRDKPILTVCIYHKSEDFFDIPLLIDALVDNEYEYFIRQYRYGQSETVLYAMPKSRKRG